MSCAASVLKKYFFFFYCDIRCDLYMYPYCTLALTVVQWSCSLCVTICTGIAKGE